jgi:uncharacterized protein (DUF2147 family)
MSSKPVDAARAAEEAAEAYAQERLGSAYLAPVLTSTRSMMEAAFLAGDANGYARGIRDAAAWIDEQVGKDNYPWGNGVRALLEGGPK